MRRLRFPHGATRLTRPAFLTSTEIAEYARLLVQEIDEDAGGRRAGSRVNIRLNGESAELPAPMSIAALLLHLGLDTRRVAVELNLVVLKRAAFETTMVKEGDEVEIVNFVGGGTSTSHPAFQR
jgi:sulfur carrier protein